MTPSRDIQRLLGIMAALRTPGTGCPWDLEQTFATIAPYTIEEAYEVADAIQRGDLADLQGRTRRSSAAGRVPRPHGRGDGAFAFGDVVAAVTGKLVRRHPHVFGGARDLSPEEVKALWDEIKRGEKASGRGASGRRRARRPAASVLDGVPSPCRP